MFAGLTMGTLQGSNNLFTSNYLIYRGKVFVGAINIVRSSNHAAAHRLR